MKIPRQIHYFLCILFLLIFNNAGAQSGTDLDISIHLSELKSITVNQSQQNLNMVLENRDEVLSGKQFEQANHIEVFSTSEYEIIVYATSELQGNFSTIPVNTVRIIPQAGDIGNFRPGIYFTEISLATFEQSIIKSLEGDIKRTFNIVYKVTGWDAYMDNAADTYSTTITYSIIAI